MKKIKISGICPSCGYCHSNSLTTMYKNTRYAACKKCGDVLPFKIYGCLCSKTRGKIIIGECSIHAFLKKKGLQS